MNAGKLKALGVTSAQPAASLPNVPSIASVVPRYEGLNFHGLHAPAKTPQAIVAKLHDETTRILQRPDVKERLNNLAMDVAGGTPQQYRRVYRGSDKAMGASRQVLGRPRRLIATLAL